MESLSAEVRGEIYEKLWTRMPRLAPGPMSSFRIDDFITLIRQYPIIYNRLDKHNKQEYADTWDKLEAILKTPKKFLMMKWKGLRDNFRVELKKEYYSAPENPYISKWVHYKKLAFLKEQVLLTLDLKQDSDGQEEINHILQLVQSANQDAAAHGLRDSEHSYANSEADQRESVKVKEELEDAASDDGEYSFHHFQEPDRASPPDSIKPNQLPEITITRKVSQSPEISQLPISFARKRHSQSPRQSPVPEKRPRQPAEIPQDDDYHFLMSIHPYLKQLPLPAKLKVRLQMQQVLFNELMKQPIADEED